MVSLILLILISWLKINSRIKDGKQEPVIQRVNVKVFGFNKRDSSKKDEKSVIGEKPIIFTLGQQVQGGLDGRILSSIGLSSIKSSLLIVLESFRNTSCL